MQWVDGGYWSCDWNPRNPQGKCKLIPMDGYLRCKGGANCNRKYEWVVGKRSECIPAPACLPTIPAEIEHGTWQGFIKSLGIFLGLRKNGKILKNAKKIEKIQNKPKKLNSA